MRVSFLAVMVLAIASCAPQVEREPNSDPAHEEPQSVISDAARPTELVTLSSYSWDYAPWLECFQRALNQAWQAPYAYRLGVISGKVSLQINVMPSGEFFDVLMTESEGHESLHKAAFRAVEDISGLTPLPVDFPEESLRIGLTLHYPEWRKR